MKSTIKLSLFASACGLSLNLHAAPVLVPNGDFEIADGASWSEAGDPNTTFSFPVSGGNLGGYGVMNNNGTPFGVFIANDGDAIPLGDLGLTAGKEYNFFQDMRIDSGTSIGKLKLEFYDAGGGEISNTGDIPTTLIGDGSTWETYLYPKPIPPNTASIKFVPIWGPGSAVGYDNIGVDNTPIVIPPAPPVQNPDFEIPGGANWGFFSGGAGTHSVDYPATGGNPGGFAQISSTDTGYAGIAANGNAPVAISTIGMVAGETYTFTMDMKIISGPNIGKFKVDFIPGSSPEMTPVLIGDGSTWENYSFDITLPANTTQIMIVPLWGKDSVVGFDNIKVIIPEPKRFDAGIRKGTVVTWELEGPGLLYQAQGSFDQEEWDNIGPLVQDDAITSAFDEIGFPFYRVEVSQNVLANAVLNGGFEEFNDPSCADAWVCFSPSSQPPVRTTDDFRGGEASIRIAVQNNATPTPNQAELQQNISEAGGSITVGESYTFSFWAKQISSGVSYVQNFRLQWLDFDGAILAGGTQFASFTGGSGVWKEISVSGLVPPDGAVTAYIQIFGATGAVASADARGEVLIDDLSLVTVGIEPFDDIFATAMEGVEISWLTEAGKTYQIESSPDLTAFVNFGAPRTGDGNTDTAADTTTAARQYYRVVETP